MAKRIPLDSVCEKKISTLPSQYEGKINYVDISSIENETKQIVSTQCLSAKEAPSRAKQLLEVGDILVSTVRPNLNAVAMVRQQAENLLVGSTGYCVLRCNDKVDKRYVFYFCQSPYFVDDMTSQATGASYPAVSSGIVKNSTIPFCSIEEQVAIADNFDKLSQLIILRKQQLTKLDELVKARFVELFGDPILNTMEWNTDTVNNLCKDIYGGGTPSKSHPEYYENGDIPWVSSKDMKTDILYESQIRINQLGVDNSTAKMVPVNSVIMVIRSGILKHTLPVAINAVPITVNQDLKVFIPNHKVLPVFLLFLFKMLEKDILTGVRAVTADNIELNSLKERFVIVPPIELQNQFTEFVKQTDKSKLSIQQSLNKLELLKKALMQKYFG